MDREEREELEALIWEGVQPDDAAALGDRDAIDELYLGYPSLLEPPTTSDGKTATHQTRG